jgi:6-phosphofructokinase 2
VIITVTLNPSLDRTINVNGLKVGESNRWSSLRSYAGGKGIDVSRAVHAMDGQTVAYGFIGGSEGRMLEILLDEEGVLFSFTPVEQSTRTNFIINDSRKRQQTIINAAGPHISRKELDRFFEKLRRISPSPDTMVISGSVPPGVPVDIYYSIIMEIKRNKVRTILDATGQWLSEGIKAKPHLIKPSVREAEELLNTELPTEEAIIKAAFDLVDMGIETVVISRGKDGMIAATKRYVCKAVPPPVKVRSAVGAGDCAVAGLALKLTAEEPLAEACRLGTAMGTAAVLTPGTELCHKVDVEQILPQIKVWEIPARPRSKAFFPADN